MSKECSSKVTVDTTEGEKALEQLQHHSRMTASQVIRQARKSYTTLTLLGGILGVIIPAWFSMMINAVFSMAQTIIAVATAESLTGIGLLKASFSFTASTLLFLQGIYLAQQKEVASREINNTIALLNLYGGVSGI